MANYLTNKLIEQKYPLVGLTQNETSQDLVYGYGTQTSTKIHYLPPAQSCAPFQSHADCDLNPNAAGGMSNDWTFGWSTCCLGFCPSKRKCARVDKAECDIGRDILNRDPLIDIKWNGTAPKIRCAYNVHKINTLVQLNNFVSKNGTGNEYDSIMKTFCALPSHVCPPDPETGKPMNKCSKLLSLDSEGSRCRSWAAQQNSGVVDAVKNDYCLHNLDSPDCRCINRIYNPLYTAVKADNPFADACWFVPCSTSTYLTTSEITEGSQNCPTNICQVIYDLSNNKDVLVKDNNNNIKCDFSSFNKNGTNGTNGNTGQSNEKSNEIDIIPIIVIGLFLLILFNSF